MIQGVRDVFEIVDLDRKEDGSMPPQQQQQQQQQQGKIVLIGRGVAALPVAESLEFALQEGSRG
jgi:L-2-hydroxyglutarate oxidase LhgO